MTTTGTVTLYAVISYLCLGSFCVNFFPSRVNLGCLFTCCCPFLIIYVYVWSSCICFRSFFLWLWFFISFHFVFLCLFFVPWGWFSCIFGYFSTIRADVVFFLLSSGTLKLNIWTLHTEALGPLASRALGLVLVHCSVIAWMLITSQFYGHLVIIVSLYMAHKIKSVTNSKRMNRYIYILYTHFVR